MTTVSNLQENRKLDIPHKAIWIGPSNHPMTKKLEDFFEKEGAKIKVVRIFPGSLLDVFEFKVIKSKIGKKRIEDIVSKFALSIGVSNLSFWDCINDSYLKPDRMAIQIPRSSYNFKLPKVQFLSHERLKGTSDVSSKRDNCTESINKPIQIVDPSDQYFLLISRAIEDKLKEFNINAQIINVLKGPVVDTFELELGTGVKVARVNNLTDDLSLALMGTPIRIVCTMKGKSTIGIEVPRNPRDVIFLDELLKSPQFHNTSYKLPIALGKDTYGDASVIDLASTPHLLVSGINGSGKSNFLHSVIVSLITKFPPKKLRLILLDPKQLEFSLYQHLPHLIMPVVTAAQNSSIALMWAIEEMERRYSLLKDFGVKNIEAFNNKIKNAGQEQRKKINMHYPGTDIKDFEMPYIVIVVDEFADLVLSNSGKAIETMISRIAAMARASGIHLILTTQRPSTDILTGVIKANFPTRVAFRVSTNIESRIILDAAGAEKLLGRGDMLFRQGIDTFRLHSAYVLEDDIQKLVSDLAKKPIPFDVTAMEYLEKNKTQIEENDERDYEKAVDFVIEHRIASASFLQRMMCIGYNHAAALIERMEDDGVVGPLQGAKPRKVLIGKNEE